MEIKKTLFFLLILFGESLIILSFIYFGSTLQPEILYLNIVVTSLLYCIQLLDFIIPWVEQKDKTQKKIASIGIRWFFSFLYSIFSIGVMIIFNTKMPILFVQQLIIHSVLFFIFLFGQFLAFTSSEKAKELFYEAGDQRKDFGSMIKTSNELLLKLNSMKNIPPEVIYRINSISENLRFLSPCSNNDATILEKKLIEELNLLSKRFSEASLDFEKIDCSISDCNKIFNERKQLFSN